MNDYLVHYGVKGMKWGIRKRSVDQSRTVNADIRRKKTLRTLKIGLNVALIGLNAYGMYKAHTSTSGPTIQRGKTAFDKVYSTRSYSDLTLDDLSKLDLY